MRQLRYMILFFATLAFVNAGAQWQVTIKDSVTQEPVPYVSAYWGQGTGGYSDESGIIVLPEGTEQVQLSHICYETKNISMSDFGNQVVILIPKNIVLDEVNVSAKTPKRTKTQRIGLVKEKTQTAHRGTNGFEMALFIPYDSAWTEAPYIHSILASLDYSTHWMTFTTIKSPIYATLRFDLRLPDTQTGAPRDESLIDGGILCPSNQRVGKDGIRLNHPIPFPKTGIFVVVEWISTASVSESQSLVPALNMTLNAEGNRTWNKKSFRGMDWMREQDEPIYHEESAGNFYKGRTPTAKLGLVISK
ncbi:MAG: hypothetical protein IJV38_01635 [Prevotella sp.]|nr:hypothetical protein [Prevotella sp.]